MKIWKMIVTLKTYMFQTKRCQGELAGRWVVRHLVANCNWIQSLKNSWYWSSINFIYIAFINACMPCLDIYFYMNHMWSIYLKIHPQSLISCTQEPTPWFTLPVHRTEPEVSSTTLMVQILKLSLLASFWQTMRMEHLKLLYITHVFFNAYGDPGLICFANSIHDLHRISKNIYSGNLAEIAELHRSST